MLDALVLDGRVGADDEAALSASLLPRSTRWWTSRVVLPLPGLRRAPTRWRSTSRRWRCSGCRPHSARCCSEVHRFASPTAGPRPRRWRVRRAPGALPRARSRTDDERLLRRADAVERRSRSTMPAGAPSGARRRALEADIEVANAKCRRRSTCRLQPRRRRRTGAAVRAATSDAAVTRPSRPARPMLSGATRPSRDSGRRRGARSAPVNVEAGSPADAARPSRARRANPSSRARARCCAALIGGAGRAADRKSARPLPAPAHVAERADDAWTSWPSAPASADGSTRRSRRQISRTPASTPTAGSNRRSRATRSQPLVRNRARRRCTADPRRPPSRRALRSQPLAPCGSRRNRRGLDRRHPSARRCARRADRARPAPPPPHAARRSPTAPGEARCRVARCAGSDHVACRFRHGRSARSRGCCRIT